MKTYNYGILGPGHIARSYAKALVRSTQVKIYAIASRDGDRARAFAKDFDAVVAYDNYEALAKDPNVDVIYIATPHGFHEEHALLCLQNKKPVVCEKPLALTYESSKRMIDASRKHQTFLMEGMWSQFNPTIQKAKSLIDAGAIGEVKWLTADFGFSKPYDAASRLYDLALGGGSILDVGVYPLFLALYVLGKPDSIQATAHLAPTGADESCSINLGYNRGAMAQLYSSMTLETKKEAIITGTNGIIVIHTPWYKSMSLTLIKGNNEEKFSFPYDGNGFEFQVAEVSRCLDSHQLESKLMSHDFSLMKAAVSDEILRQAGISYQTSATTEKRRTFL